MMPSTTLRPLVPAAASPAAALTVRAVRNYDSIPKRKPFSSSRSILDEFLRQEKPLVQRTKDQITDYCTTIEGDECCSCWDAYFELNKLEQELPKDEIARMVKDSEGDVRYLIDSIHHRSNLRKKMAEKTRATVSSSSLGQSAKPRPFPVPDGLPKTQEELAEEEEALMPESSYTRLLRRMGRYPDWDNIREYRDDSERLDQCSRLDDLSPFSFEFDAGQITQEAVSISTTMNREKISIESLMTVIKEIMWNTGFAIRSYVKLRPRFVHLSAGIANHSGSSGAQTDFSQLLTTAPSFHCYSSATRRPSPFVQHTIARFEDHLGECCKWILELEQLVQTKNDKTFAESLESLSKVMSNVHDYLIHLASKAEHIHQSVETMKTQYLNNRRCRGDLSNPFLKANRREEAKQQATARIKHPMLHLPPPGQPTTVVVVPVISSQLHQTSFPTVATSPRSYPTLPLPSVLPPSRMQTSPAPLTTNPLSSPWPVLQFTPFGSFSTLELGSTQAASLLGTGTPFSATSLFPIPSGGMHHMLCATG